MSRTPEEQLFLVLGYITAMKTVTETVKAIRAMFLNAQESHRMTNEEIGSITPGYLAQMEKLWGFSEIELPELTSFAIAIYAESENAEIGLSDVLEVARDLYLHRLTDEQAKEKLTELRSR